MHIGAAADGDALALQAGVVLVDLQQFLHQLALFGNVVGRVHLLVFHGQTDGSVPGLEHLGQVLVIGTQRGAAVGKSQHAGLVHLEDVQGDGQLAGDVVFLRNASADTVEIAVRIHRVQTLDDLGALALQRQCSQQLHQRGQRVVALVGSGSVGVQTLSVEHHAVGVHFGKEVAARLFGNVVHHLVQVGGLQTQHLGLGRSGDYVELDAGIDPCNAGQNLFLFPGSGGICVQAALFDVDDGIVRIGRQRLGRNGIGGKVVGDVGRAALLVRTEDDLAVLAKGHVQLLQRTHGVEGSQRRALVIGSAAAVDLGLVFLHLQRRTLPAVAGGDDVQVGKDAQLGLVFVHVGGDDVIIMVYGGKAVLCEDLLRLGQHVGTVLAVGHAGQCVCTGGVDGDELLQVCKVFTLVGFCPGDDALLYIHSDRSFLFCAGNIGCTRIAF